jgi:prepilin-type N-terminal cleavage/methylation domain-containing protein
MNVVLPRRFAQPRARAAPRAARAFTLIELLIVAGIISLLSVLTLTVISQVRIASQSTRCMANLHTISIAFSQYVMDNEGRYPMPAAVNHSWEGLLQPYLSQKETFHCLADTEMYPVVGSSYDWRDTPDPLTTLAGRKMTDVTRTDCVLAFETLPGWHAKHFMNCLCVNGQVLAMNDDQCLLDLQAGVGAPPLNAMLRQLGR